MDNRILKPLQDKTKSKFGYIYDMICEFINNIVDDEVGVYAAQSTFYIILSAIPSLMIILHFLKYFIPVELATILYTIDRIFPPQISQFVSDAVTDVFYRADSTTIFSVAFVTLLWASSKGTMAVYCGLNKIYGYTKEFSWLRMRILSFFYNLLFFAVIIASVVVLAFGNSILSFFDTEFIFAHVIISFLLRFRFVIFFVLFIIGFAALYTFLPQRKAKFRVQLWGAGTTALGWLLASYAFSIYMENFSGYSYIYGSLTAIMLLALLVFFFIYILLIGAEVNKHVENGYFRKLFIRIMRRRVKKRKKM